MPPALFPAVSVLGGAVAGTFIDGQFPFAVPVLAAFCAAASLAWWHRASRTASVLVTAGFFVAALALAGTAREEAVHSTLRAVLDERFGGFQIETPGPENDHDPVVVRAELIEDAAIRGDYVSLRARVIEIEADSGWQPAAGGVTFTVSGEAAAARATEWRAGRIIDARATFRRPARYLNEGVPDFERQLALDGITLFGSIKSAFLIAVVRRGSAFQEWAARVRVNVRAAVQRWVAPHDATAAAIVTAVLIGDRTGLPDDVTDRLQRAGTYHVIAISGGNIAVLAGLVFGLLALSGLQGSVRAAMAIAALLVYAQVASGGPSVWRATTMAIGYLAARLLDHRTPPWQATTLAAALMAIMTPLDVRNAGFILTFGATGALLESARRIAAMNIRLKPDSTVARWTLASVCASIAVELALMPVSAAAFSRVTLAGPLLNLAAVPLMAVAQIAGLVVTAFDWAPSIAGPAGRIGSAAAAAIVESARFVDAAPALAWRVPSPGVPLLGLYYASLLAAVFGPWARARVAAIPVLLVALLCIIGIAPAGSSRSVHGLRLTMFDVGQGEAMLLESGALRLQIDSGGAPFGSSSFDIGARVVAPALWARGVHRLDALLLTHGDPDHMGGAQVLLESFAPRRLWEGIAVPRHAPSRDLRARAIAVGIGVEFRRLDESLAWGNARIRVLHPPDPDWERPRIRNDDSVVLEVTCGEVAILLTGDIGGDVEREIAPRLTPARTRVLKVGHHGSRTSSSSALLEAWRPQIALISAGRGNTFGHPAPEVIQRLESIGADIYRTDRDGQITLESDCHSVAVRAYTRDKR